MGETELQVAIDVGARRHRVAVGERDGTVLEEFDVEHTSMGLSGFIGRLKALQAMRGGCAVAVAMEGFNGWARPLDRAVLACGWRLYNVNNLKLARYKEIFPAPAKTDAIDARRILELFRLRGELAVARDVLQPVIAPAPLTERLKRLTRRRRQLLEEKVRLLTRLQVELQAVCPGLLEITGEADNLWFLSLLSAREDLRQLARMHAGSLLKLAGVGRAYAGRIQAWQREAIFSDEAEWVGPMIVSDARRVLALKLEIKALEADIETYNAQCALAQRIDTVPGFGRICSAELAGEIGCLERFATEASLAMYVGMAALDHSSGKRIGARSSRQVNTRAKAALMIAAMRHLEQVPQSRAHYEKKRREGKTHNQAVRAVGRQLVRVLWSMITHERDYERR
jgi:transposase